MSVCPLCNTNTPRKVQLINDVQCITCDGCGLLFKHPQHFVDASTEKDRYLEHQNDVEDKKFQNFVAPIINSVTLNFSTEASGLDFGAGTAPVITKVLADKGFHNIVLYDPFFHPKKSVLASTYEFIMCCEVIEHFHTPNKEFKLLHSLLKPGGKLFCMTGLIPNDIELKDWWYIRDSTHVVFYSEENLLWIKKHFGFHTLEIDGQLITFTKK